MTSDSQHHESRISLAQWALVEELHSGRWKNLDFPRVAAKDFGIHAIEFVNTFFEAPTETYLQQLNANAAAHGVKMLLIMIDDEGDGCASTAEGRRQFVINHRKWVDIAHYLGCHAIRTNCRGLDANPRDGLKWAAESYHSLLDYAGPSGIRILIENHGGLSNDGDWIVTLMKEVNHPLFGTYPDWREPSADFDNVRYLQKTLPFAGGMSYRNQPTEELTAKMVDMCKSSGYRGWFGIESNGRSEILKGKQLLERYLSET